MLRNRILPYLCIHCTLHTTNGTVNMVVGDGLTLHEEG